MDTSTDRLFFVQIFLTHLNILLLCLNVRFPHEPGSAGSPSVSVCTCIRRELLGLRSRDHLYFMSLKQTVSQHWRRSNYSPT